MLVPSEQLISANMSSGISGVHSTICRPKPHPPISWFSADISQVRKHPGGVPLWIDEVEFIFFFVPIEGRKNASGERRSLSRG
jgi:hypothetical protein